MGNYPFHEMEPYSLTENSSITNSNIKNSYNHTFNIGSNFFKKIKKIF